MTLEIYPVLASKMLEKWGTTRENWENGIREVTGIQTKLVFFFWEVESMVSARLLPNKLTLECHFLQGWLPVIYTGNVSVDLRSFIKKKLIHFLLAN